MQFLQVTCLYYGGPWHCQEKEKERGTKETANQMPTTQANKTSWL